MSRNSADVVADRNAELEDNIISNLHEKMLKDLETKMNSKIEKEVQENIDGIMFREEDIKQMLGFNQYDIKEINSKISKINIKLDWVGQQNGETSKESDTDKIKYLATSLIDICKIIGQTGALYNPADISLSNELKELIKTKIPEDIMNKVGILRRQKEIKYQPIMYGGGPPYKNTFTY